MRPWIKRSAIVLVLLSITVGGVALWKQRSDAPEKQKFRTAALDEGPITQVVLATGALQPVITVTVGTQVSGTVLERKADFNDRVKKGQVLLRLDPANLDARVRQARAQLAAAQAAHVLALTSFERNQKLVVAGFVSSLTLDQGRREVDAAVANVDLARAQVSSAETDLANSVIRAPIDGIVIRRNIDIGQTVAASFQTPELYLLAKDLREMVIQTSVSEADVGLIKGGQIVRFTVDAYPEREFEGTVGQFRLNSTNTQGVVTYTIIVNVANPEELLKPGMTAQARIVVATKDRVVRIPTAALRFRPDEDSLKGKEVAKAESKDDVKPEDKSVAKNSTTDIAKADDDGVLTSIKGGKKVYRLYTVGEKQVPSKHDVTIGISNTRFTELITGDLKIGDLVITRSAEPPVKK
jgi:HlyD family secretion protein